MTCPLITEMKNHLKGGKELIPWLAAWHLCTATAVYVEAWVPALLLACRHFPPCCFCLLMRFVSPVHGIWCTPLSPVLLDTLGCGDSPQSWGRVRSWGLVHLGRRAWEEEVEGRRRSQASIPSRPGESPFPRGRSGRPTRGREPVRAWPC